MSSRKIKVDTLARVEGEGGLTVRIKDGQVAGVEFRIFEPPRFFEAFLRGRHFTEAPDITARICGICPVAYQMSSCHAMEDAAGATVGAQLRNLRRLLYCGEWIESHVLHVYMLHAPDFLGYQDSLQIAQEHPELVSKALQLKKIGNDLMALVGGREIHPINVRVGGFYRVPTKAELAPFVERLKWAIGVSRETVRWTATLPFPDFERDYEFVALHYPDEYAITEGRLVSNRGLDISPAAYEDVFHEVHVEHSNALQSVQTRDPKPDTRGAFFVGPLARFNLNFEQLTPACQDEASSAGVVPPLTNPFKSIVVRSIETLYACEEALRLIEQYEPPAEPFVEVTPRAARGFGITEAPRGSLYHRYDVDADGLIASANIVPPTSQNLRTIEDDLREYVTPRVDLPQDELTWQCEQAVRNYDPCISCATHFLRLSVENS